MIEACRQTPPLSPVLLAGFVLRPLPPLLLRPLLNLAMSAMRRRHPAVFGRLNSLAEATFLIDPVDLPFSFLLRPGAVPPVLEALAEGADAGRPTAILRGPLLALIDLLEGRIDGDALFFSRDLVVEGDMEAVLTLRNAVDSGEVNVLEDLLPPLGPLNQPTRQGLVALGAVFRRATRDLETLRAAFVGPVAQSCERQATKLSEVEEKVADLGRKVRRKTRAGRRVGANGNHRS
jgi:predicted lipid carrier protein YhbT